MEIVPLSERQLTALAKRDPVLRRMFWGLYPEDQLPPLCQTAGRQTHRAMIVNTDPKGEPGRHWLGLWTSGDTCESLDSCGLPMDTYGVPHVLEWIWRYFLVIHRNERSLQSLNIRACGHYALLFLQARCRGKGMHEFMDDFSLHDLVANNHQAGHHILLQLPDHFKWISWTVYKIVGRVVLGVKLCIIEIKFLIKTVSLSLFFLKRPQFIYLYHLISCLQQERVENMLRAIKHG